MTTEEKAKNAIKWIESLVNGQFKQGKYHLGNDEIGYCCWGVGCKVVGLKFDPLDGWNEPFYKYAGFNNEGGNINPEYYSQNNLGSVNDNSSAGFKRIGKYLIKHANTNFEPEVAELIKVHFN